MNSFINTACVVCDEKFKSGDDIVVCPECGAPYHRACYAKSGKCMYESEHASGFEYKLPQPEVKMSTCANCKAENPETNLFCENCGIHLGSLNESIQQSNAGTMQNNMQNQNMQNSSMPFGGENLGAGASLGSMFGLGTYGAAANKTFDGISSGDWSLYIGNSAPYYLYQFSRMDESGNKRKTSLCWSALLFSPFYFAYRKMWGWTALSILGIAIINIPSIMVLLKQLGFTMFASVSDSTINSLSFICMVLNWVISIFFGLYALYLFRQHAIKKIQSIKNKNLPQNEYSQMLVKSGAPSIIGIVAILVGLFLLSYLFTLWVGPQNIMALYGMYY